MYIRQHSGIDWLNIIKTKSGHARTTEHFLGLPYSFVVLDSDRKSEMHSHKPLLAMDQTVMSLVRCHSNILHCVIQCSESLTAFRVCSHDV